MVAPLLTQAAANPELAPEVQGLERQRRISQMLLQQGMQAPQGQMVSGHFVAPNPLQHIANLANTYIGVKGEELAGQKELEIAKKLREANKQEAQDFIGMYEKSGGDKNAKLALMLKASESTNPMLQNIGAQMFKNEFNNEKTNEIKNYEEAKRGGFKGTFLEYETFMANRKAPRISVGGAGAGVPQGQGGFDKKGNWVAPNGAVFTQPELKKDREIVNTAAQLKESLSKINPQDVKASDTILGNVTESPTKSWFAKNILPGGGATVAAQNKINAAGVMQLLNNLPPGPASDKDIMMARSTFPGYGNAEALNAWIQNTNNMLDSKVGLYEQKYGGMGWYGNAAPTKTTPQGDGGWSIKEK